MEENVIKLYREYNDVGLFYDEDDISSLILNSIDTGMVEETIYDYYLEIIETYKANKSKPYIEWEFNDDIKNIYIYIIHQRIKNNDDVKDEELILFRKYIEDLIAKDNVNALEAKAYLTYGDSLAYPCDWYTSRDSLIRLFELTENPEYANSLGYIYYYGRCNNSNPEYEKAFKCFTYGYIHHLYESSYKLADMYKDGKGVMKSMKTYEKIIDELYRYSTKAFYHHCDNKFSDIALRKGNLCEKIDPIKAYGYYLQAEYAIKKRLDKDYYGDNVVYDCIKKAINGIKNNINHVKGDEAEFDFIQQLIYCTEDAEEQEIEINKLTEGYKLIWKYKKEDTQFLITIPEADYCALSDEIVLYFDGDDIPEGKFCFNRLVCFLDGDEELNEIKLMYNTEIVICLPFIASYKYHIDETKIIKV